MNTKRLLIHISAFAFVAVIFLPAVVSADAITDVINPLIKKIDQYILNPILVLMFFLAALYFFWGVFKMVSNVDNPTELATGKQAMIWGVLGMVIMISAYGIVNLIIATFNIDPKFQPDILKP